MAEVNLEQLQFYDMHRVEFKNYLVDFGTEALDHGAKVIILPVRNLNSRQRSKG
jgi:hypothetical protein